jgi:hypothetical protein
VDQTAVTAGRTARFPGTVMIVDWCGHGGGDGRMDDAVPGCGGDGDGGGGG